MAERGGMTGIVARAGSGFARGLAAAAVVLVAGGVLAGCSGGDAPRRAAERSASASASASPAASASASAAASPAASPVAEETPVEGAVNLPDIDAEVTGKVRLRDEFARIIVEVPGRGELVAWLAEGTVVTGKACGSRNTCGTPELERYLKDTSAIRARVKVEHSVAVRVDEVRS